VAVLLISEGGVFDTRLGDGDGDGDWSMEDRWMGSWMRNPAPVPLPFSRISGLGRFGHGEGSVFSPVSDFHGSDEGVPTTTNSLRHSLTVYSSMSCNLYNYIFLKKIIDQTRKKTKY